MRRLLGIFIVVLLGVLPIGAPATSTAAQTPELECEPSQVEADWWSGICQPIPEDVNIPAPPDDSQVMQPFSVVFAEEFAATRPLADAEFMIVYVREGVFVLDREESGAGSIAVSSSQEEIPILSLIGHVLEDDRPYYDLLNPIGFLENPDGSPCTRACAVQPSEPVMLRAGDMAIAQAGTLCLWCLLGTNEVKDGETGVLEVYALRDATEGPETFSWSESWASEQARTQDEPTMMTWAFNPPGTKCGGG